MTTIVPPSPQYEELLSGGFDSARALGQWKNQNIYYVVKVQVHKDALTADMLSVNGNSFKRTNSIPLTGQFSNDRHQMHILADSIHKALFGKDGIACTHVIYTTKMRAPDGKSWISEVFEADYDGGNCRQITHEGHYCITPAYIPPKPGYAPGNFFYVSYQQGEPKIYAASLKEGKGHRFISLSKNQLMPAINRDRDKIAFISDVTGNPDLFIQPFKPDTGAIEKPQLIFSAKRERASQGSPTFSPDGKQIAFVSNKDGHPRIYVLSIPASGASLNDIETTLITKRNRENTAPAWSPDGTKLAYCSMTNGARQIWVYDFDTKQERQLTQGPGNKENPTWAPNSLHIIFNSTGSNASELYLINLNQPEAKKITSGPGEKRFPCWEPR
jgi:TolB protein